jgi:hypothetical protein
MTIDFDSNTPKPRLAYQQRWWKVAVLLLSGTSLFLILSLLQF